MTLKKQLFKAAFSMLVQTYRIDIKIRILLHQEVTHADNPMVYQKIPCKVDKVFSLLEKHIWNPTQKKSL